MRYVLAIAAMLAVAAPAAAQEIRAGMTMEQVRSTFGDPARTRTEGNWTYLFYANGCPVRCGSDDVVFLQDGRVIAAVLRTSRRHFAGPRAAVALGGANAADAGRLPPASAAERATRSRTSREAPATRMRVRHVGGAEPASDGARPALTGRGDTPPAGSGTAPAVVSGIRVDAPVGRMGADSAADLSLEITSDSATGVNQRQINREKRVTPRVIPKPKAGIDP